MSKTLSSTTPLSDEPTRAGDITPGGQELFRRVAVTNSLLPLEADVVKSRLEAMGIPAMIEQEAIGSVMGLTVGPLGSAKVLVSEAMAAKAMDLLAETFETDEDDIVGP